jgi:hypothetical protein
MTIGLIHVVFYFSGSGKYYFKIILPDLENPPSRGAGGCSNFNH